jgi:hypothetical protein
MKPTMAPIRLQRLKAAAVNFPSNSRAYWNDLAIGGFGSLDSDVISPEFVQFDSIVSQLERKKDEPNDENIVRDVDPVLRESENDEVLDRIGGQMYFDEEKWWVDAYFRKKGDPVLDHVDITYDCVLDSNGTVSAAYDAWAKEHPRLANRFISNKPPKPRKARTEKDKDRKKELKEKETVGISLKRVEKGILAVGY